MGLPRPQAKADGKTVRALVVINPGNPTGGVLAKGNQVRVMAPVALAATKAGYLPEHVTRWQGQGISFSTLPCSLLRVTRRLTLYGSVRRRTWF